MNKADDLRFMLERCQSATDSLLKDITEDESLCRIDGYPNHIRWEAGHMARGSSQILSCLTDETDFPQKWTELFSRGSVVSEDPSIYPSLREIRDKSANLYSRIFDALETMDDVKLEQRIAIFTEWIDTRIHGVLFLCLHDFYHGGQIMILRRAIGKERVFG